MKRCCVPVLAHSSALTPRCVSPALTWPSRPAHDDRADCSARELARPRVRRLAAMQLGFNLASEKAGKTPPIQVRLSRPVPLASREGGRIVALSCLTVWHCIWCRPRAPGRCRAVHPCSTAWRLHAIGRATYVGHGADRPRRLRDIVSRQAGIMVNP